MKTKPPKGAHPPRTPLEKDMVGVIKKFGLKKLAATPRRGSKK